MNRESYPPIYSNPLAPKANIETRKGRAQSMVERLKNQAEKLDLLVAEISTKTAYVSVSVTEESGTYGNEPCNQPIQSPLEREIADVIERLDSTMHRAVAILDTLAI
jgi:hypothetical protein